MLRLQSRYLEMCKKTKADGTEGEDLTGEGKGDGRRRETAPCWLPCTGRRTSVCPTGLHTPSVRSSGCSHVTPELQQTQSYSIRTRKRRKKTTTWFIILMHKGHVDVWRAYVRLDESLSAPPNALKAPWTFRTCA